MTNLQRLILELSNKMYYTESEYTVFLEEQGLTPTETYDKTANNLALLNTVADIFQTLSNNIEYFRSIETEFATTTEAYNNLKSRLDELYKRIELIPSYEPSVSKITYLYHS